MIDAPTISVPGNSPGVTMRPRLRRLTLTEVLDQEAAEAEQTGLPLCLAPHHTDPGVVCQRSGSHGEDGLHSQDVHAARRVWHDGEPAMWGTWT